LSIVNVVAMAHSSVSTNMLTSFDTKWWLIVYRPLKKWIEEHCPPGLQRPGSPLQGTLPSISMCAKEFFFLV